MSYRFKRGERVVVGVRRIAVEQIDAALECLSGSEPPDVEHIHSVRTGMKKLRALLNIVRPSMSAAAFRGEDDCFRAVSSQFATARDATAVIHAVDALVGGKGSAPESVARVRDTLQRRRASATGHAPSDRRHVSAAVDALRGARERVASWPLEDAGFAALEPGLARLRRRARRAMRLAYEQPDAHSFHAWRKTVKAELYALRLLEKALESRLKKHLEQLESLADALGEDHDLVVLHDLLTHDAASFGGNDAVAATLGRVEQRRVLLEAQAREPGERLFGDKARPWVIRLRRNWQRWRR